VTNRSLEIPMDFCNGRCLILQSPLGRCRRIQWFLCNHFNRSFDFGTENVSELPTIQALTAQHLLALTDFSLKHYQASYLSPGMPGQRQRKQHGTAALEQ